MPRVAKKPRVPSLSRGSGTKPACRALGRAGRGPSQRGQDSAPLPSTRIAKTSRTAVTSRTACRRLHAPFAQPEYRRRLNSMKRTVMFTAGLLALVAAGQPATAADIQRRSRPAQAPPPVMTPVPVYNWTGFYVGAHGGYAWADTGWTDTVVPGSFSHNSDGFLAGGQIGFNYQ